MAAIALAVLLGGCTCSLALNPSLDISQYGHTAWTIRDGFARWHRLRDGPDADGYLWLASEFGLFRSDGVRFVRWEPPAGQQLPESPYALLVTRDGTLWIGTFAGLASWNNGKLTQYPEVGARFITSLLEDREGTVWVGTLGGSPGTPPVGCAQFETAAHNATDRMAPSAVSSGVWVRTVPALSGLAQNPVFGTGSPVRRSAMRCPECGLPT